MPARPVSDLGTILSIWAHPDDETYLAGGLMAAARANGQRVVCVSLTAGERGTSDPVTWPPDRVGRVRRWEAAAAMAVLGVGEHRVVGLPDGALAAEGDDGPAAVDALVRDIRPDTIVTFGADGMTFHADHIATHHWVTGAWRRAGAGARLLYATTTIDHLEAHRHLYEEWDVYMTGDRPCGVPVDDLAVHLRLAGVELDRKLAALRAMATQTGDAIRALAPDVYATLVAEECFVEAAR